MIPTYFLHYLSGFGVRCWETVPGLELGIAVIEMNNPEILSQPVRVVADKSEHLYLCGFLLREVV